MTPTLFQRALAREELSVPPIWMMRQAGRYHKHYQTLRSRHSFMELCKNSDLAAQVALGPVEDFDFDVAILFSDLLFPLEVLGMPLTYEPGPKLGWHLQNESQLADFASTSQAIRGLEFQAEAVRKTRALLGSAKSLIGFVGGPWTLFVYAVEGSHQGGLLASLQKTALFTKFCAHIIPLLQQNIALQLEAGGEAVMILDTAAGETSPQFFAQHLAPQLALLAGPKVGYYMKGGTRDHYGAVESLKFAGLGYDHRFDLADLLKHTRRGFVQGNFHQNFLTLDDAQFESALAVWLEPLTQLTRAERAGWIAGLGHGVIPQARESNVRRFVEAVRTAFK